MKRKNILIIYTLFCLLFLFINALFLFNKISHPITLSFNKTMKLTILAIMVSIETMLSIIIYIMYIKKFSFEKIFLVIAIPIGLLFLILLPVGFVPDELNHFLRSYEISTGKIISDVKGIDMPIEISNTSTSEVSSKNYSKILDNIKRKNSGKVQRYSFKNTSLYNFVCYIPQVIGIIIGKIFNFSILLDAYLGRIVNYCCWVILIYLSIKYIPFCKNSLMLISLLPITLQEAVSLSPDSLTYAISMFLISYVLYLSYKKKSLNKLDYILLSFTCIVISLCKIVYLPICLILFIIPKEKFKSLKDKNIKIISLAIFVFLINIIWLKIASNYLVEYNPGVNSSLQIKYVLNHLFSYIIIICSTIIQKYDFYLNSMFGGLLGSLNVKLSYIYPILSIILLIVCTICERLKNDFIKLKDKIWLIIIFISVIILIFTSLYIQWTPLKSNTIDGIQGRYFLPILILVPLFFLRIKSKKLQFSFNSLPIFVLAFSLFADLCALIYILSVNL